MDRLSRRTLGSVAPAVAKPPAAALDAEVGIVHLGLGAFHRAHQAILTQRALAVAPGPWAISGASLRSPVVREALRPQDCLYALIESDGVEEAPSVVGVLREALFAPGEAETLLARLAASTTRIVTLTVTEKGYCHQPATGDLDLTHPDIRADLTRGSAIPARSTLGWLVRGLAERRSTGAGGLTVLCCDNMASNGQTLGGLVRQFAGHVDPALASWIEDEVRFPSSMVDRIVPAATAASLAHAANLLGLRDEAAVSAEAFVQWVIEDDFAAGRPRWEAAGAELVRDVGPYQELKLRLLNGAHSALAYLGALLGKPFVADVMADPALASFVERLMLDEIAPHTPAPPGYDVAGYAQALLRRFASRTLRHRTLQIAMDGSQKIAVRWLPVLREARRRDSPVPRLVTAIAVWLRFLGGRDEAGRELPLDDPLAPRLRATAAAMAHDPAALVRAVLEFEEVFGPELRHDDDLVDRLTGAFARIARGGVRAALAD
jgi:fructuronate reductase